MLIIDADGTPRLPGPETVIDHDDILLAVTNIEAEETLRNALTSSLP
jgi:hypothetical protein